MEKMLSELRSYSPAPAAVLERAWRKEKHRAWTVMAAALAVSFASGWLLVRTELWTFAVCLVLGIVAFVTLASVGSASEAAEPDPQVVASLAPFLDRCPEAAEIAREWVAQVGHLRVAEVRVLMAAAETYNECGPGSAYANVMRKLGPSDSI